VNFGAGTKNVFVTYPAERAAYGLTAGSNITLTPGNGTITIDSTGGGGTNLDGGLPDSSYAAIDPIDGGTP